MRKTTKKAKIGRPRLPKKQVRSRCYSVRVSAETARGIKKLADTADRKESAIIHELILEGLAGRG